MSDYVNLVIMVEGKTELTFVKDLLFPYLFQKNIFTQPIIIGKPGHKGGNVSFERCFSDISIQIKQRSDTYVSTFIDYYGLRDWPGLSSAKQKVMPEQIAETLNVATADVVAEQLGDYDTRRRFVPFVAIHEFESLLFSSPVELAKAIGVNETEVNSIIEECGEPEKINNSFDTAPSKRLEKLCSGYKKTVTGITAAKAIGIDKMRQQCPVFNAWVEKLEKLKR